MKVDPKWLTFGLTDEQAKGAATVGWRALIVLHIAYACGWLAYIGLGSGFALADEVDQKIASALEPVVTEQREQRTVLETLSRQLTDQLANSVASEIRYLVGKRCKEREGSEERERLQREIDRKQIEYESYRKQRYVFNCSDI